MYCSRCGTAVPDNSAFCGHCGQRFGELPPQPVGASQIPAPVFAAPGMAAGAPPMTTPVIAVASSYPPAAFPHPGPYAGFWLRLVAYIIDTALLGVGMLVVVFAAVAVVGAGFLRNLGSDMDGADNLFAGIGILIVLGIAFLLLGAGWIYYAWFESSRHQATPGKLSLGLMVTDMQGRRVTFARASGRFFAKIITDLIPFFIGYILAGCTEKKQALHDMIASCLVLRRL
ncbi:MAG TPA: RDD family protein [Candidatus Cybelea sp.]|nr:RDD family protein [Candidatus Cybelea sp.]